MDVVVVVVFVIEALQETQKVVSQVRKNPLPLPFFRLHLLIFSAAVRVGLMDQLCGLCMSFCSSIHAAFSLLPLLQFVETEIKLEMWANAQRDGCPAEYRSRPLLNAALWLTPTTRVLCSNAAKTRNPLKLAGVPQTNETISAASGPKFTIL